MSISQNLKNILATIPSGVKLIAVSKTKPNEAIVEAYQSGQRIFGENKAQELAAKQKDLPSDIEWHMIGHMQSNKVKYIAPFVALIHSVDSLSLLQEINKQALKNNRIIGVLLQFYIAEEESKFGFSMEEAEALLNSEEYKAFKNIEVCGVMGMATFTENQEQIKKEFKQLKTYFTQLKSAHFSEKERFNEISMGMSGDYLLAIQEGSTMVRVGSSIFGGR
ncbi:MAG: YggS family pyridoxal phosphate-dependent enzyme [Flavobacteriales bacterium]